ncbi:MAG: polysaccharide deacetylase family protein [Bacteroidales bacterium]|nr:polysaccharide deacetylase family protein [Bacteroidales bacterium]
MLLIYTHKITNRINYIFKLIFKELLGVDFTLTSNIDDFRAYSGIKFNYSKQAFDTELFFAADNLLFERGIKGQDLSFIDFDGSKAFFTTYNKKSVLPFDPFAASFYLVSRYEEYLPYMKDKYGRFSAKESIAFKQDFLQKPLVNIWTLKIADIIKEKYPSFNFPGKKYKFIPTIDIDAAYAYRLKGFIRTAGAYFNSLFKFDLDVLIERTRVLIGLTKDPFDTYEFQLNIQKQYDLKPIYFILFADYGLNDKNIPVYNSKFQTLIKSLADYAQVGIHPSFGSNTNLKKLKTEVERLSKVLNKEITKSRQHFLKLDLPVTYRNLINLDITDDYTMGFAAAIGFRAGICNSFMFYNIDLDTETNLRVHPFAIMEGTLRDYMNVSASEALSYIKPIIEEVKAVNGTFITLWHNESLSNSKRWVGWDKVYEEMVKLAL